MRKFIFILITLFMAASSVGTLYAQKKSVVRSSAKTTQSADNNTFSIMSLFGKEKFEGYSYTVLKSGEELKSTLVNLGFKLISSTKKLEIGIEFVTSIYEKDGIVITDEFPVEGLSLTFANTKLLNSFVEKAKLNGFKKYKHDNNTYYNERLKFEFYISLPENEIRIYPIMMPD